MNLSRNCLKCAQYFACKDPAKSIIYTCQRFSTMKASNKQEAALLEDILELPFAVATRESHLPIIAGPKASDDIDVFKMLKSVINDNRIVSPDIKVPEGDFPEAPNFYTWCVSDKYLNQKPFVAQAIIGTRLFAEYCVAQGSLIITGEGVKRIEDVCSSNVGMNKFVSRIATSTGIEKTSKSGLTSKSRKCLSISTYRKGRNATVTPEHKLLVFREGRLQWIEAKNVRLGDFLTAKIGQNLWPKKSAILPKIKVSDLSKIDGRKVATHVTTIPKKTSIELSRFIGYCLSDGTIDGYRVGFINTCENLRNDFVECGQKLFGIKFKTQSYVPKRGKQICYTAGHASVSTSKVLADLGVKLGVCYDKEIPDFILQSPKHEVVEFIKALFDCDGYMHRDRIGICMSSKKLVDSLSILLDNLGVYHYRELRTIDSKTHSKIKNKKNRGSRDQHYVIEIRDIRKFCELIGTNNTQRLDTLSYNLKHGQDASELNTSLQHNVKPGSIPDFDTFVNRLTLAKSEYHGLSLKRAVSSCHRSKSVALDRILTDDLFAYCTRYDCLDIYQELLELQKHNFAYYQVCRIEDAGKHQVYDLTVPGSESFVCNGINVHNCPDCTDMEWMLHTHKVGDSLIKFERKVALLEHGKCPHCHVTRLQFFKKKKLSAYVELALSAGQRSGKSALTAMLTSYLVHRAIKMERPNEVYGLLKATVLQGTFVALTFAQAKDTLWDPFYGNLLDSPWFQQYHGMLDHVQSRYGEDELYKLKDTFVAYKHRRISVYPAGPDKRVLRGRTRLFASIDELGWFPNDIEAMKNVKMNATEVYIALERSLLTVRAASKNVIKRGFYNVPMGYFINISSPSSVRDKIMELVRKAQNSTKILGLCKPTWEMNPNVPKSVLAEEFKKDPVSAMRDYGAQPPLTNNAFISNKDSIITSLGLKKNGIRIHYEKYQTSDGSLEIYGSLQAMRTINRPCILSLDAGYSNNSFAFSIGYLDKANQPVIAIVGEIIPTLGMRINHSLMYSSLLSPMFETCNIVKVVADRWNSLKILADMEIDHGAERQIYSLKYADMQMFKSYLDDNQVTLPAYDGALEDILKYDHSEYPACFKNKPVEHFLLQLLTVQDTGTGVIKGDGLTDDIARSVFLLFQQLIDPNNEELLNAPAQEMKSLVDGTQMAVYKKYSGGGSSNSMGGGQANQASSLGMTRTRL